MVRRKTGCFDGGDRTWAGERVGDWDATQKRQTKEMRDRLWTDTQLFVRERLGDRIPQMGFGWVTARVMFYADGRVVVVAE